MFMFPSLGLLKSSSVFFICSCPEYFACIFFDPSNLDSASGFYSGKNFAVFPDLRPECSEWSSAFDWLMNIWGKLHGEGGIVFC